MWRKAAIAIVWALCTLLPLAAAAEVPSSSSLCVLPVLRGSPGEADDFQLGRMIGTSFVLPGLSAPILYGDNRGGVWTVADGLFQQYGGAFPHINGNDQFAIEPDTGRIIGLSRGQIFATAPGTREFSATGAALPSPTSWPALAAIDHLHTAMVADRNSLYRLDGGELHLVTDKLPYEIGYQGKIADLPIQKAVLIASGDGAVALVRDDGSIDVMRPRPSQQPGILRAVLEVANPPGIFIQNEKELLLVQPARPPGERVLALPPIPLTLGARGYEFTDTVWSNSSGTFVATKTGLKRLGTNGLESFLDDSPSARDAHRIIDAPLLGGALISEPRAIFVFDGNSLTALPNSGQDVTGLITDINILGSTGKILVGGTKGLFEVTTQHVLAPLPLLVPIPLPLPPDSYGVRIAEMPSSQAAVIFVSNSAYELDQHGRLSPIPGGEDMGFTVSREPPAALGSSVQPIGVVTTTGELIFKGPAATSLYRVVDRRIAGAAACAPADRPRPPQSTLCFRPIDGANDSIGAPFGDWVMAPTNDRLLIQTSKGVFQIDHDRHFRPASDIGDNRLGDLVELPWEGSVFLTGWFSNWGGPSHAILQKSGKLRQVTDGASNRLGSLYSPVALPSLKIVLRGQ